jgi:microcystin-dependent protein
MSEPYVGEIRLTAFSFAPQNEPEVHWLPCDGRTLSINDYEALHSLIGQIYSEPGDEEKGLFRIPNLSGRIPIGPGPLSAEGEELETEAVLGQPVGEATVKLSESEIPPHTHSMTVVTAPATSADPSGNCFAATSSPYRMYLPPDSSGSALTLSSLALSMPAGTAHANIMPSLGLTYMIAASGAYPSRGSSQPRIRALEPSFGPSPGANPGIVYMVDILGGPYGTSSSVTFGNKAATIVASAVDWVQVTPPSGSGTVAVQLTTKGSTTEPDKDAQYTYIPSILSMEPSLGSSKGGTRVKITGVGFTRVTQIAGVQFGSEFIPHHALTINSDQSIELTSPAGLDEVDVQVILANGWCSEPQTFAYLPGISEISPAYGDPFGGTSVMVSGYNFTDQTEIYFGSVAALSVNFASETLLYVTSPSGTGDVTVIAKTQDGTSKSDIKYSYRPIVTELSPDWATPDGRSNIQIRGDNFTEDATVLFGSQPGTVTFSSQKQLSVRSPAGSGVVEVSVVTAGGSNEPNDACILSYVPKITSLTPAGGSVSGGTPVVIAGHSLTASAKVTFGGVAATVTDTLNVPYQITVASPAGSNLETVAVEVTTAGGTSPESASAIFTYGLAVTGITPPWGCPDMTTTVTVIGYGFSTQPGGTIVKFGETTASNVVVTNSGSLTCTAPAGMQDLYVTVTVNGFTSPQTAQNLFTYKPVIEEISPKAGSNLGGTQVALSASSVGKNSTVFFGDIKATIVSQTLDSLIVTAPPGNGLVPVRLVTQAGVSDARPDLRYEYFPSVTKLVPTHFHDGQYLTISGIGIDKFKRVTFLSEGNSWSVDRGREWMQPGGPNQIVVRAPVKRLPDDSTVMKVIVVCTDGTTNPYTIGTFYGDNPVVTGVSTHTGNSAGNEPVTITGTGFAGAEQVWFVNSLKIIPANASDTEITTTTPPGYGTGYVNVQNAYGVSDNSTAATFEYSPTLDRFAPDPVERGATLTLYGRGLENVSHLTLGVVVISSFISRGKFVLSFTIPLDSTPGRTLLSVENPAGSSNKIIINIE